jgi:hypothetical protein
MAPPQMPPQGYPQQPPQMAPNPVPQSPFGGPPQGYQQPPQMQQPNFGGDPFVGLTSGDPSASRNPFLEEGSYKLKLVACKFKASRAGKSLYIIETEILQSNNPARPPGMHCSSFIDLSNRDTAGRHLAAFVTAIHGYDPTQLPKETPVAPWVEQATGRQMTWAEYAKHSIHDSNPWAGREIGCNVQSIETKAGNDFSLHTWIPASKQVIGAMMAPAPVVPTPPAANLPGGFAVVPGPGQMPGQGAPGQAPWGAPPPQGWGQPGR